jgi:hypothetical protein
MARGREAAARRKREAQGTVSRQPLGVSLPQVDAPVGRANGSTGRALAAHLLTIPTLRHVALDAEFTRPDRHRRPGAG